MNKLNRYTILTLIFLTLSSMLYAKGNKIQTGKASWYGKQFNGRLTASGERYNMYDFTAAHRTLPFNTMVEVTNLQNGRSIIVRVNDRGPYAKGRIMDLSYLAAKKLGYVKKGVAKLKLKVLYKQKRRKK
ncbi:septal ring lytic transglycosylase RlpA family protein [Sulfurovum sp. bin170]|uniref:septal ring lytic transglycosylase RlpA family protein n=1 Tax=Sulfurovum sp. bin170 TaxID=2695268 RepID=UPI0013DEDA53|nr:septal ring lytic transglycosylase RlpA family protein [Sulfurovum sp. bin170]NEW61342.1 septal ring lytic transglycosylase RlpA family protein [Sulfurovum sp. bin170]